MKFKIPSLAKTAFNDFLETAGIEEQVFTCKIYHDYYDAPAEEYRVEMYMDSSKSRYDNSDNRVNARFASTATEVDKGDMMERGKDWYILDWRIEPSINDRATRALYCNQRITILRSRDEEVDDRGMVIREEYEELISEDIPVNISLYQSKPEYSATSYSPGSVANNVCTVIIQYNEHTANIRQNDYFKFGIDTYEVVNVSYAGVNFENNRGVLTMECKKKEGLSES